MNNTIRKLAFFVSVMLLSAVAAPGAAWAGGKVSVPFDPVSANVPSPLTIDNPLLPLVPGDRFTFVSDTGEVDEGGDPLCEVNTSRVLDPEAKDGSDDYLPPFNPKIIHAESGNLPVITVYDVVWTSACDAVQDSPEFADLEEVTFDWYAQDKDGNVLYVGEWTYDCEDGDCDLGEGSWETNVDGAIPGIVMLAHISPGAFYDQEFYEDFAEDKAKVLRAKTWVSLYRDDAVLPKDFHNCVRTKEWSPLERGFIEQKSYCPAQGNAPFPGGQVSTKVLHGKTVVEERIQDTVPAPFPPDPGDLPTFPPPG